MCHTCRARRWRARCIHSLPISGRKQVGVVVAAFVVVAVVVAGHQSKNASTGLSGSARPTICSLSSSTKGLLLGSSVIRDGGWREPPLL